VGEADRLAHLQKRLQQPRPVGRLHLGSLNIMGDLLKSLGEPARALRYYEKALA
jgi:hypothetical protein